jgi:hypothetical protein
MDGCLELIQDCLYCGFRQCDLVVVEDVLLDDVEIVVAVAGDGHWFFVSK